MYALRILEHYNVYALRIAQISLKNSLSRYTKRSAIFEKCGPLTNQEEDNIVCLQHLLLQLQDCEEDDIREELKLLVHNLWINLIIVISNP